MFSTTSISAYRGISFTHRRHINILYRNSLRLERKKIKSWKRSSWAWSLKDGYKFRDGRQYARLEELWSTQVTGSIASKKSCWWVWKVGSWWPAQEFGYFPRVQAELAVDFWAGNSLEIFLLPQRKFLPLAEKQYQIYKAYLHIKEETDSEH